MSDEGFNWAEIVADDMEWAADVLYALARGDLDADALDDDDNDALQLVAGYLKYRAGDILERYS